MSKGGGYGGGMRVLTVWEILLVGKDEEQAILHLAVVDDPMQLLPRLVDARAVG